MHVLLLPELNLGYLSFRLVLFQDLEVYYFYFAYIFTTAEMISIDWIIRTLVLLFKAHNAFQGS